MPAQLRWELLVIDNGSSDGTQATVRDFAGRLPVRVILEPAAGVCFARNRAIVEARGRYVCWTDDDVLLTPDWLAAYHRAFEQHPDAIIFGGPIEPMLEAPVRALFERYKNEWPLAGVFAQRDLGPDPCALALEGLRLPFGANFAVRSAELQAYRFDPRLGPSPQFNRLADELDLIYRMMKAGAPGQWVPDARLHHVIARDRQTLRYLLFYYRRIGQTVAWLHDHYPGDNINEVGGHPAFARPQSIRQVPAQLFKIVRTLAARTRLKSSTLLGYLALYGYGMGILEHRRAARAEATPAQPMGKLMKE